MILPAPFAVLVLESVAGSARFHDALAALEAGQSRPSWATLILDAVRRTRTDIPDDDTATYGRTYWFRLEGARGAGMDLPRNPCPGVRLYLPGEDAPVGTDPLSVHDAQYVLPAMLGRFLITLDDDGGATADPAATPATDPVPAPLEPAPEPEPAQEPQAPPEPEPTPLEPVEMVVESEPEPQPVVVEVPPARWTLLPDAQIDALDDEQVYNWITTLERDYNVRPPRNVEFTPVEELRIWLRETVASDQVRAVWERQQAARQERPRPEICTTNAAIHEMSDLALSALQDANDPPELFARAAQLVRVARDESGGLYIQEIGEPGLAGILDRLILWTSLTPKGGQRQARPPRDVVRDILALPAREWGVPPLVGVTQTPILHTDGSIYSTRGYDEQTRLYYSPDEGFVLAPIPERPTPEDVAAALAMIEEVFADFPFIEQADRANAYGALLTAILRPSIDGPVPLYLVDKPQAGSGAGLLQRVIGMIALGCEPPLRTMPTGEEMRKEILTSLRQGTRVQIFDNLEDKLSSPVLAAALTAPRFSGRILGKTEEISLDVCCFWMANGNNVVIGGDLARRTFKTRIDPQVALPWQREGFRHPDLPVWVASNRGRILAAVFTLARAWIQAGRPVPTSVPRIGSFEGWRDTIGGILEYAGVHEFMGNADAVYLEGDADRAQWEGFLSALWERYRSEPFTVGTVVRLLGSEDPGRWPIYYALPDDLSDAWGGRGSFSRILGNAFARQNGRHFPGGWCLRRGKLEHKVMTWLITYTPPTDEDGGGLAGGYVEA
ncbi:hypothetical protein [Butyricicoccus intestinisimiae]|jgi:hypothetical protein|uniref:hypothetical protein n=1 Tax=Butyricicoccus intestinisimiae TaxID=2841509 RepID=UPI003D8B3427